MKTLFVVTRIRGQAWDASQPMHSQAQWPELATFMNQLASDGFVVLGGPIGDKGRAKVFVMNEDKVVGTTCVSGWVQEKQSKLSK